ncbi:MAG: hypothetical protein R3C30_09115 [Hyphomonadaceae bacterium]
MSSSTFDIGYRYFESASMPAFSGSVDIEWTQILSDFDADYTHQAVTVGLRYQFARAGASPATRNASTTACG